MPRRSVQERREEIVDAAIAVMSREGVAAATTRRIAGEAGLPLSALHYCFASKDVLLDAVLERIIGEIGDTAGAPLPDARDLSEALELTAGAFWALVEADDGLQTMQYELTLTALRGERSAAFARRQYEAYVALAQGLYERTCARSGEQPAIGLHELARFVVAGLDGLILQHLTHPDAERSRAGLRHLVAAARALAGGVPDPGGDR